MNMARLNLDQHIVSLIGYRCSGKTTVGRLLAERMGWEFADADDEVSCRAGKAIQEIFAEDGEPAFREMERSVIADLLRRKSLVLSVGGGAILCQSTADALKQAGPVVWLVATPQTIVGRMQQDANTAHQRPALTDKGITDEVSDVLEQRVSAYSATSTLVMETDEISTVEIADQLFRELIGGKLS